MKRKGKTGKKSKTLSKRKDSLSSDDEQVSVSSSLPPSVEGQIRCFLTVSVYKFTWTVEGHPEDVAIRIRWWGEQGQGTLLRPLQKDHESVNIRWSSIRYPVCSGPKQFAAYLNDMSSLLLETVHASTHIPFAKALISEITKLTASHPVNVVVPFMSVISPFNKVAEIQIFIRFESVSAAYNKLSSTIPTVDTGLDKENIDISNPHPTPPPYLNPATPVTHPKYQREVKDPFESPAPVKGVKFSDNPPERLEYSLDPTLLSLLENDFGMSQQSTTSTHQIDTTTAINKESTTATKEDLPTTTHNDSTPAIHENRQCLGVGNMDWIGALLERGQRLREGLAMSTLLDGSNVSGYMNEQHSPPERHVLPGRLFKEILSSNKTSTHHFQPDYLQQTLDHSNEQVINNEDTVIDLLMGEQHGVDLFDQSSYMSDMSENLSEIGDPLHDDSLLMDLFYKSQGNKSAGSDTDNTVSTDEEQDSNLMNVSVEVVDKETKVKQLKKNQEKNWEIQKVNKEDMSKEGCPDDMDTQQVTEVPVGSLSKEDATVIHTTGDSSDIVHKLGADTLTTLGRVNTARLIIDRLQLIDTYALEKQSSSKKPSTFFVEYHFPMTAIKDTTGGVSMAKELTRVASKKVQDEAVMFNHRSVFPVLFNASILDQWWSLAMTFRVFKRESGQRMPVQLGIGVLPLKKVLLSSNLSHTSLIEIKEHNNELNSIPSSLSWQLSESDSFHRTIIGKLEVKVELGLDGKQLHCQTSTPSTTAGVTVPQQAQTNITMVSKPVLISGSKHVPPSNSLKDSIDIVTSKPPLPKELHYPPRELKELEDLEDMVTLHSLLWIPEGKGITLEPHGGHGNHSIVPGIGGKTNLFLVSRMFWCNMVSKSPICWGTSNPQFGFKQVAPVLLTPTLLQRTCNNVMVIEVWDKVIPQGEKLVGIVKLPLHQFYLSYRDPKITKTLIKSKFPVICVDNMISINNPFTTCSHGEIKVLLAMGTQEQISCLLEIKGGGDVPSGLHNKELHHLDKQRETSQSKTKHSMPRKSSIVDHQFEITVEDIRGLSIFKSTVWGETDCYVQYHFPSQIQNTNDFDNEAIPGLKSYYTSTTLCVPDPSFQDITRHSFLLPPGVPVQRYLLAAYSGSWTSVSSIPGSGGVPFELWRRYYYPNVRDQLVAKASLPVAKLCAMVTMKRHREPSVQTFSLPLVVLPEEDKSTKQNMNEDSGLLDVSIKYRANKIHTTDDKPKLGDDQVCLSVDVIRMCGLKEAAKLHAYTNQSMSYPADVGVNAYVLIKLPIGRKKQHVTRTVARTFAPEFSHHIEVMTPLQMTRKSLDSNEHLQEKLISLAEKLEMTEAVFEVWHQHSKGFGDIESQSDHLTKNSKNDVLMGVVSVPLADLLTYRTGIRGWHAIKPEEKIVSGNHHMLGGLQLSIKFEDPEDREAVVHVGRNLGWSPPPGVEYDEDEDVKLLGSENEDGNEQTPKGLELSVKISMAWVPRSLIDNLKGHTNHSNLEIKGYVRYKLYDKSPICSRVVHIRPTEKNMFLLDCKHSKCFVVPATSSLVWYLREESLEVQVWLRGQARQGKDNATLPGKKDTLIGSAFINLSTLVSKGLCDSQSSGIFPLFKAGADTIDGASVHLQISLAKPNASSQNYNKMGQHDTLDDSISSDDYPSTKGFDDNESESLKSSTDQKRPEQCHRILVSENQPKAKISEEDVDTFAAHIIVQEACHLSAVAGPNGERVSPNAYVTYQTSISSLNVSTSVYKSSTSPVWEYQKLESLPLSTLKRQNLIFKVWHKPQNDGEDVTVLRHNLGNGSTPVSDDDLAIGFASVDLGPLAAGLRQLIGWYNIMDFNGECKGQIKVGVVPLTPVSPSRCLPKSRRNISSPVSSISKSSLFHLDSQEQQTNVPVVDLLPSQEQAHLDSFQRLGSIGAPQNTTSTSLLFRKLRENMKELDNLQRGLQGKLFIESSGHGMHGVILPPEENPSHIPTEHHTQQVIDDDKTTKPSRFTISQLDRPECLSHDKKQPSDIVSESENIIGNCGEKTHSISIKKSADHKDVEPKASAYDDHLQHSKPFEKNLQIDHSVMKHENICTDGASVNTATEVINTAIHDTIEGTVSDLVQNPNLLQNIEEHGNISKRNKTFENTCSSVNDLEESVSDSIEDSSYYGADAEYYSAQIFAQEKDSWLSSTEEEETKSPLSAGAYSLTNSREFPTKQTMSTDNCNKHSPTEKNSSDDNKQDQGIEEVMNIIDEEPSNPDFLKDVHDYMQNETLGDANDEGPLTNHGHTTIYDTGSTNLNAITHTKLSLPNFFMPTQQLEHSMRALRLGARLSHSHPTSLLDNQPQSKLLQRSYRNKILHSNGSESNAGTREIVSQFSQKQTIYKAKNKQQPPLSATEIDRIARIFSSKDS